MTIYGHACAGKLAGSAGVIDPGLSGWLDEWFMTCGGFKESNYRFQRTSTWQKTRITRQPSIMKTPPRLIGWLRSTMERAIMHQARSTRRPPSITLVRHTKPRRRLTKNLNTRSSLQLELHLPVVIQDLATGSSPSGHGRAPTALENKRSSFCRRRLLSSRY